MRRIRALPARQHTPQVCLGHVDECRSSARRTHAQPIAWPNPDKHKRIRAGRTRSRTVVPAVAAKPFPHAGSYRNGGYFAAAGTEVMPPTLSASTRPTDAVAWFGRLAANFRCLSVSQGEIGPEALLTRKKLGIFGAACIGLPAVSAAATPSATTKTPDSYARPGKRIVIGQGRGLNLRCRGKGPVTVLLEAGSIRLEQLVSRAADAGAACARMRLRPCRLRFQ